MTPHHLRLQSCFVHIFLPAYILQHKNSRIGNSSNAWPLYIPQRLRLSPNWNVTTFQPLTSAPVFRTWSLWSTFLWETPVLCGTSHLITGSEDICAANGCREKVSWVLSMYAQHVQELEPRCFVQQKLGLPTYPHGGVLQGRRILLYCQED